MNDQINQVEKEITNRKITSDLNYIYSKTQKISSSVNKTINFDGIHMEFKKNKGIYGKMNNMLSSYYNSANKLMDLLKKEADEAIEIAENFAELDRQLESEVLKL